MAATLGAQPFFAAAMSNAAAVPLPESRSGTVLAFALGGSSDIIGVLAYARALGFRKMVLVQPGSPARGAPSRDFALRRVEPCASDAAAPGGEYFDNGSMVAYLLSRDNAGRPEMLAGYYLAQPKDDGAGFSAAALEATTAALIELCITHRCTALAGLDFGADVAMPTTGAARAEGSSSPHIVQRDLLNLRAAAAAAKTAGIPLHAVASSPGIDAAAVAPTYASLLGATPPPRLFEMTEEGALELQPETPPPECALTPLPVGLLEQRVERDVEESFGDALLALDAQIMADAAPAGKRAEHASKTYHLQACCIRLLRREAPTEAPGADGRVDGAARPFVAVGMYRGSEKARAHVHSSYCTGLYRLDYLLP